MAWTLAAGCAGGGAGRAGAGAGRGSFSFRVSRSGPQLPAMPCPRPPCPADLVKKGLQAAEAVQAQPWGPTPAPRADMDPQLRGSPPAPRGRSGCQD